MNRNELTRLAVLEWLAVRQSLSFERTTIRDRVNKSGLLDFQAEDNEIDLALSFLKSGGFITAAARAGIGSTPYYQATSAGVLAFERGTLEE